MTPPGTSDPTTPPGSKLPKEYVDREDSREETHQPLQRKDRQVHTQGLQLGR